MSTTGGPSSGRPANVRLVTGATQNWSDLDHEPAGSASAVRRLVADVVRDATSVAVVGPTSIDLITGLASSVERLTVIIRSLPDAVRIGELLREHEGVDVVCGSVTELNDSVPPHDVVLSLADLADVLPLEIDPVDWTAVFGAVRAILAPSGVLLLGVENELGLHRVTSLRSRYTTDTDGDWSVTATLGADRPRSVAALTDKMHEAGLTDVRVASVFPSWGDQTVIALDAEACAPALGTVLEAVTLGSPAFRRVGADPTRLTRAAVLAGRLAELASGWLVVASAGNLPISEPRVLESTGRGDVVVYESAGDCVRCLRGAEFYEVQVPMGARLWSEIMLDAAAASDLVAVRRHVLEHRAWVTANATDGVVPAEFADAGLDNLLYDGESVVPIRRGEAAAPVDEVMWTALADFVLIIRARGARHPWPAAIDDRTMLANLGAMAGQTVPDNVESYLLAAAGRQTLPELPAHDIPGLLAVIERLTSANVALASKAAWFEQRLSAREREMRVRSERHRTQLADSVRQQEILRGSAEDLRRSLTYRAGNAILGPVRALRERTGDVKK